MISNQLVIENTNDKHNPIAPVRTASLESRALNTRGGKEFDKQTSPLTTFDGTPANIVCDLAHHACVSVCSSACAGQYISDWFNMSWYASFALPKASESQSQSQSPMELSGLCVAADRRRFAVGCAGPQGQLNEIQFDSQ